MGRGAPACAPKERADTRVCPYRGFNIIGWEANWCYSFEDDSLSVP